LLVDFAANRPTLKVDSELDPMLRSVPASSAGANCMPIQILLVEDSPGDVRLTQEAFRDSKLPIHLHVATDGVEAMLFLQHDAAVYAHSPRPDLILLDLNLPRMDGREVLARVKCDEDLRSIPIVILTTSDAEADILKSYQLQANCYLSKPVQLEAFEDLVRSINDFWLVKAQLPPKMNSRIGEAANLSE
jgi:two-component system, chemotaxis family, response regulator Rcp1